MKTFSDKIDILVALGAIFETKEFENKVHQAQKANPWFTPFTIREAANAIRTEMLDREKLTRWVSKYSPTQKKQSVGIIMAGNIPMVGFFDLLVAFLTGHQIKVKCSSKDKVLMGYIVQKLKELSQEEIEETDQIKPETIDFLLAMGSDATERSLKEKYPHSKNIIRGTRHSIAQLTGKESPQELKELSKDLFIYWGMGCRNITHLILPKGYNFESLTQNTKAYYSDYYNQKLAYETARLTMLNIPHIKANGFLLMQMEIDQIPPVAIVGYSYQNEKTEIDPKKLQCTIGLSQFKCNIPLGKSQYPTLEDSPNGIDPLELLLEAKR